MSLVSGYTPYMNLRLPDFDNEGWHVPMQENLQILDATVKQFARYNNIQGVWQNSLAVGVGAAYIDPADSSIWQVVLAHTTPDTGTFAADRVANPDNWTLLSGGAVPNAENNVVRPEDYNATGDGVADDTSAVLNAINDGLLNNRPVQFDKTYRITARCLIDMATYNSLALQGSGTIYLDANLSSEAGFDIQVPHENSYTISAIDNTATYDYGSGSASHSPCALLTLPAGHSSLNRFARITSDDTYSNNKASQLKGEIVFIGATASTSGYTTSRLLDTYTTNRKLVTFRTGKRILITGIRFTSNAVSNVSGTRLFNYVRIYGAVAPVITRCIFEDITLAGVKLEGCVGAMITACQFHRGINNPTGTGQTAYGIYERSSSYTIVSGLLGNNVRHVYTAESNTSGTPPGDLAYGWTYGSVIDTAQGFFCSGAPFDTHHGSRGVTFSNCFSAHTRGGPDISLSGFQLRGDEHNIIGCRHLGNGAGVTVENKYTGSAGGYHTIKDFRYDGNLQGIYAVCDYSGVTVFASDIYIRTTYFTAVELGTITVRGESFELYNADPTAGDARRFFYLRDNGAIYLRDFTMVFEGVVANSRIAAYNGASVIIDFREGKLRTASNSWDAITQVSGTNTVTATFDIYADAAPTHTDGIISIQSGSTYQHWLRGPSFDSNKVALATAGGSQTLTLSSYLSPNIFFDVTNTNATTIFDNFGAGTQPNQQLTIGSNNSSTQDFVIDANVSNRIALASDLTISQNSGCQFIWTGTVWLGTSVAVAVTAAPPTDHGSLTGLSDDDHSQYHTDARALTWLNSKTVAELSDVPTIGTYGQALLVNSGATALEYKDSGLVRTSARDVAIVSTTSVATHVSDTAALADASVSFYPAGASATKVALRLLASLGKGILLECVNHLFNKVFQIKQGTGNEVEVRLYSNAGSAVMAFTNTHAVIGGDLSDRVGTEVLTVIGDMNISGGIVGGTVAGAYTAPLLIGVIRLWDDGAGKLRAKSGSDPASATDGSVLW